MYLNKYLGFIFTGNYGSFEKSFSYAYYKNGLKKSFTAPYGSIYTYSYYGNNQLVSVSIPDAGSITINGYHWNRPAEMTLPGGSTRTLEYDPLMRIKRITDKDPGQNVVMDYQYTYDEMDNIVGKSTEHGDYAYGYDDLHRLTTVDNPNFSDEAFSYDAVGNRLTSAGISGNWSYNGNNELLGYDGISYEYDANGNTIQKNDNGIITDYSYDIEDRLVAVTTNNPQPATYKYYYDPFGRRMWKEVDGTRTYFMYSDEGLIAELDSSGNITKSYGYKPNSTWTTDPLFMKVGTDYYFYHNDHLGTPQKLTAINGAIVWAAKYSSFGEADINPSSTITNPIRSPGQYYDTETGLQYNYHRYYDPKLGRYLRPDPLSISRLRLFLQFILNNLMRSFPYSIDSVACDQFCVSNLSYQRALANPSALNLYSSAENNYTNLIDPSGEIVFNLAAAIAGAEIGASVGAISALFKGESMLQGALVGAGVGLTAGFTFGTSLIANALAGAAIGASADFVSQVITNYSEGRSTFACIDTTSIVISGMAGFVGAGGQTLALKGLAGDTTAALVGSSLAGGTALHLNYQASSRLRMARYKP